MRLSEVTRANGAAEWDGTWRVRTPWKPRSRRGTWQVRTPRPVVPPGPGPRVSEAEPAALVGSFVRALDGSEQGVENGAVHSRIEGSAGDEREHGDRQRFLAGARQRLANGAPANRVHPLAPPSPAPGEAGEAQWKGRTKGTPPGLSSRQPGPVGAGGQEALRGFATSRLPYPLESSGDEVPRPRYGSLKDDPGGGMPASEELVVSFAAALEDAGGTCHIVDREIPETLLDTLVAELDAWQVVISAEPEAHALGERLAERGVEVSPAMPDAAAVAGLGITSARAGIAATGSVVLDSSSTGGRAVSSLPPVHLCVLPAERLVATPSDVLRPLAGHPAALPASLVLVTGPSRSGDIEQILTIGAHGPVQLHVLLIR